MPVAHGGTINVASNQFIFKIAQYQMVHQYQFEVQPDDFFENERYISIMMSSTKLQMALGPFLVSGKNIYTLNPIDSFDEPITVFFRGMKFQVKIDVSCSKEFNLDTLFKNEDNCQSQQVLNILLNMTLRETNLKQIGR